MATVVKTFSFASDQDGFHDAGNSANIALSWDATDQALKFVTTVAGLSGEQEFTNQPASYDTWETWGVPAGATVTAVQLTAWKKKLVGNTKLASHSVAFTIWNSSILQIAALLSASLGITPVDGSYGAQSGGTQQTISGANQASNTGVRLQVAWTVTTDVGGTAAVDQRFDDIELTITYTPTAATPPAGSLTIAGPAQRVQRTLVATGYAPSVTAGSGTIQPPAGSLALTGRTPGVTSSSGQTVTPGAGSIATAGKYVAVGFKGPDVGSLVLTGQAPSLAGASITRTTGAGALAATGQAPRLAATSFVPAGTVVVTGRAPAATLTTITISAGALVLTGRTPTVLSSAGGVAYVESRLGILELNASRLGTFVPTTMVFIDGVRREPDIIKSSLTITYELNGPATAIFTVTAGAAPAEGMDVVVSVGAPTNRWFGGTITRLTKRYLGKNPINVVWECECQDYTWLLNRRAVLGVFAQPYQSSNGRAIAQQLVDEAIAADSSGELAAYSTDHIDQVGSADGEAGQFDPGGALTCDALVALASQCGALFRVDPWKHVFFGARYRSPNPHPLVETDTDWYDFAFTRDLSQVRTDALALGGGLTVIAAIADPGLSIPVAVPVDDIPAFLVSRLGGYRLYNTRLRREALIDWVAQTSGDSATTADAQANATTLPVAAADVFGDTTDWPYTSTLGGWARLGNGDVIYYTGISGGALTGIPVIGVGSLTQNVAAGTSVARAPMLKLDTPLGALIEGDELQVIVDSLDTAAAAALAALEGADGLRQSFVQTDSTDAVAVQSLADAEVGKSPAPLNRATYSTRDPNTYPGGVVSVAIAGTAFQVTTTLRIGRVTISQFDFSLSPLLPLRDVDASDEQTGLADLLEQLIALRAQR